MSIPKEKTILLKIKEICVKVWLSAGDYTAYDALKDIHILTDSYEDPGYIGGPVVGEPEGEDENGEV